MVPDGYDLAGRVALITGGGTGIGAATAALLARYGAAVAITGRTDATLNTAAREIADTTGQRCLAVQSDVRDEAQVQALVARVIEEFGRIGILVNNVGWGTPGPLNGMSSELYRGEFGVHRD